MSEKSNLSKKDENLFTILMSKYLPYWPLFATLVVIALIGARVYLYWAIPVYEITATMLIKDGKKGVDDTKLMESMNAFSNKKIVENEIEVISSRRFMSQVVDELKLYAPIFEEKDSKKLSAYTTSPIKVELKEPDKIVERKEEDPEIYFTFSSESGTVKINNKSYPINEWVATPYGVLKFSLNDKQIQAAENPLFFTLVHPKIVTDDLLSKLDVTSSGKLSSVVILKFSDAVPQRGEDILNHVISAYNQVSVIERNNLAANTLAFIEERIKSVENDLEAVEKEIQQYRATKGVVDLSEQGRLYLQKVGDNDRKMEDIQLQLSILDKVEKYVISKDNRGGIVPSTLGVDDPVLSQLLEKLYDSEITYEKLRKTTAENNPILVSVVNEIEKIRPSILENIQNQRVNMQASLRNVNSSIGKYTSNLESIPEKERELLEINRKKANKNELYSFLLQKKEETALSYAPTAGDTKVVDVAESSTKPKSPIAKVIYAIASVLAMAVGVGLITVKEVLNNKIVFRTEIEQYTDIPVIGELSFINNKKKNKGSDLDDRLILDQFRDLRLAMGLYGPMLEKRRILVTSSIEGEGKSFVSENVAISLASSGKKVVLVNFDLRKPFSSKIFKVSDNSGVSDYLAGEMKPHELVKETTYKNLFIIAAGNVTNATADILLDIEPTELFSYLDKEFDFVIVDTPPVEVAIDAFLLSKFCDTTLFVTRHAHTPKWVVQRLEENERVKEFRRMGIVFNGVKSRGFMNKGYGYGYGYGHKYSYNEKYYKKNKMVKA